MDKKLIVIIVLILIIVGMAGVFAYNVMHTRVYEKAYEVGVQDATLLINQQIVNNLNQQGFITFNYPINTTTVVPIKLAPQSNG